MARRRLRSAGPQHLPGTPTARQRELDGRAVAAINADLTTGVDLTLARRLRENQRIAFMGDIKVGPFDIDAGTAASLLAVPNPDGRSNL